MLRSGLRVSCAAVLTASNPRKAGILAESGTSQNANNSLQNSRFVILGIGINLSLPETVPAELSGVIGALFEKGTAKEFLEKAREDFVLGFLSRFHAYYEKMPSRTFMDEYRRRSVLIGKSVRLHNAAFDTAKTGEGKTVTVLDVTDSGALLVRGEDGKERAVFAGEVTLSL